jgi:hypothetical protein
MSRKRPPSGALLPPCSDMLELRVSGSRHDLMGRVAAGPLVDVNWPG